MPIIKKMEDEILAPDGLMVINTRGRVIAFDEAAERLTGCSSDDIISKEYTILLGKSPGNIKTVSDALENGTIYSNISLDFTCRKGITHHFLTSITPIVQPDHVIIGIIIVFRNTEEMRALFNAYQEKSHQILNEKNKLEAIFNSRWEGTFTIDRDWVITSFNKAAERITGYKAGQAIGRKCFTIFGSTICGNGCHMEKTMKYQKPAASEGVSIIHREGHKIPIRVNSAPLYDGDNNFIGAVETFLDVSELNNLKGLLEKRFRFENVIGHSKAMQKVYGLMENVSQTDSTVLLTGESGTGKEIIARSIHLNSSRKSKPFVPVNCSAFAETLLESELFGHEKGAFTGAVRTRAGRFELAGAGTLFLDEIGDISPAVQVKLLRVLESREFERVGSTQSIQLQARIIVATNKNLEKEIETGRFREDLFYRINVINIPLPPLRERMEDLPHLINFFIEKYQKEFKKEIQGITPAAFHVLEKYTWPGNIRELENVIEHAFVVCHQNLIDANHLPERLSDVMKPIPVEVKEKPDWSPLEKAEKQTIITRLNEYDGHRAKTAQALGIDKATLWRKMKKFRLL